MPLYNVTSLRLVRFTKSSFFDLEFSAKVLAGIVIDNQNFVGVDIYAALADIYYPDWYGNLQQIGFLRDTTELRKINDKLTCSNKKIEDDGKVCLSDSSASLPFLSVQPRSITMSDADVVSLFIENIGPKTYLNLLKDAFNSGGSLEILVSGVAHVKSPLGIPLSFGVICDNTVDLMARKIQIVGRKCSVESINAGWKGLSEGSALLRTKTMENYVKRRSLMNGES